MNESPNELERLLESPEYGAHCIPEVLRLMRETELVFMLPYHPELMNTETVLKHGDPLPPFVVWSTVKGRRSIPVFTSLQCAQEACRTIKGPSQKYALGTMPGKQLFDLLRCQPEGVVLNPACHTRAFWVNHEGVQGLSDGSILDPTKGRRECTGVLELVDPAEYPTNFVQKIFECARGTPAVEAVWITRAKERHEGKIGYVFVVKATGDWKEVSRGFWIMASGICPQDLEYGFTPFSAANTNLKQLLARCTPIYAAPGCVAPAGAPAQVSEPG